MDLPALNRKLDGGDARGALVEAEVLLREAGGGERLQLLLFIARCQGVVGAPVEALRASLQARALAVELGDVKGECEALLNAGASHQRVDEHGPAITYFEQAEHLLRHLDDAHLHHGLLRRMGVSCSILGRHDQALAYIQRSIDVLPPSASAQDRMSSRNSLINAKSRRIDAALKDVGREEAYRAIIPELEALIRDSEAEGCHRIALLARANYGTVLVRSAHYAEGIEYLSTLMPDLEAAGMKGDMGAAYGSIGMAHLRLDRYREAIAAFREGLAYLGLGSVAFQRDIWDGLAQAHEALDEPREALAAVKQARALEQKLADASAVASLEKLELRGNMARVTAELAKLADEDALTGLPNRRAAERALRAALGSPDPQPVSLLFLDLDHFKRVNDEFGHATGDRVLQECAQIMRQGSRSGDLAARWGGEEFLVILQGADAARAHEIAERLRHAIQHFEWKAIAPALRVTVSIGLSSSPEVDGGDLQALVARADERLYAAKARGRNRVEAG